LLQYLEHDTDAAMFCQVCFHRLTALEPIDSLLNPRAVREHIGDVAIAIAV
jgi:hypothetical protein